MNPSEKNLGIYIHIPFCISKCGYCDFYSIEGCLNRMPEYLEALKLEMVSASAFHSHPCSTLYLGGGTPSLLNPVQAGELIGQADDLFPFIPHPEITLEANPRKDVAASLSGFREAGINRLSVGIQSFHDHELAFLGRTHTASEAVKFFHCAKKGGFVDTALDLIYGIPCQTQESWIASLKRALDLEPTHISAYALTFHASTPLGRALERGDFEAPDESRIIEQFLTARELLTEAGFEQYEVSNYSLPGCRSRHNEAYWTGKPYLGFGPSAHSFDGTRRFWNVPDLEEYIRLVLAGLSAVSGSETPDSKQRDLERTMLELRRMEGIPLSRIGRNKAVQDLVECGLAVIREDRLTPTARGFLLADELAIQLSG